MKAIDREVRDLALRTAEEIEKRDWTQGALEDDYGCVCLFGGMGAAAAGSPRAFRGDGGDDDDIWLDEYPVAEALSYRLSEVLGFDISDDYLIAPGLVDWNDRPGRRKEDVLEALRAVAYDESVAV